MRIHMRGYYSLRWQVLERDKFTCQYCGRAAPDTLLEVDHIIPVSEGGEDEATNLITSCYSCNRGKNGLTMRRNSRLKLKAIQVGSPKLETTAAVVYRYLLKNGPTRTTELVGVLGLKHTTILKALRRGRDQGYFKSSREGKNSRHEALEMLDSV